MTNIHTKSYDLASVGIEIDFAEIQIKAVLPKKEKTYVELMKQEKIYNKKHRKQRVIVEHTICRIKKFGIMQTSTETD